MAGSEITGHIVSGNSQAPGKVESQPKPQNIVKCFGRIVKYLTKDKGERSNTSSSILGASSSPEIKRKKGEYFKETEIKEPRQWLKRKQNQDAGDGAVEIIDAETSRKNDSPVKALEQRQATTLNAKDNPLERTNALISDDNQIKEKGNGKQNQDAGDGKVKTELSRDSVVTSENDASVTTVAQPRTKANKDLVPGLLDKLGKKYEEHKDLSSCKSHEDFLMCQAVKNFSMEKDLPKVPDNVFMAPKPLDALETWIKNNKTIIFGNLTSEAKVKLASDIREAASKSGSVLYRGKSELKKAEAKNQVKLAKIYKKIISEEEKKLKGIEEAFGYIKDHHIVDPPAIRVIQRTLENWEN